MGLNGFTEWLFSALLSWMQIIYNWFWSMLASGGQNEFMPWFSDNWLKVVLALAVIGLVVDYTIYLMRWQPYHVWLTALRRARGYVVRPFEREKAKPHYAGYKRVLEGYEGEKRSAQGGSAKSRSAQPQPRRTAAQTDARRAQPTPQQVRVSAAQRPAQRAAYAGETYAATRPAPRQQSAAPVVHPAAVTVQPAPPPVDAEPLSDASITPAPPQPMDDGLAAMSFGEPPQFVRSERGSAPMYGRVYQGPGQAFMAMGMDMAAQRPAAEQEAQPAPVEAHAAQRGDEPVQYAARRSVQGRAAQSAARHVIEARPVAQPAPRQISVRAAAKPKDVDFDDEID